MRATRHVDAERLLAFEQLLAREDERALRGAAGRSRGHHITAPGQRGRQTAAWLPAARVWLEHRLAISVGDFNSWKPASLDYLAFARMRRLGRQ
jgi:hypothetical protein